MVLGLFSLCSRSGFWRKDDCSKTYGGREEEVLAGLLRPSEDGRIKGAMIELTKDEQGRMSIEMIVVVQQDAIAVVSRQNLCDL